MKLSVIFHDHIRTSMSRIVNEVIVPKTVIEIGVFEGSTTFNLAMMLGQQPEYQHYAIDPFMASENLTTKVVEAAREMFKSNLEEFSNVELIEKTSFEGLLELHNRRVMADLIYVDGSHRAKDVLLDATLGFELLNVGGVLLFDDAISWRYGDSIHDSPKQAVDAFISCNWDRLKVLELPNGYQVAVQKTA